MSLPELIPADISTHAALAICIVAFCSAASVTP
jgi:hypothetical protein